MKKKKKTGPIFSPVPQRHLGKDAGLLALPGDRRQDQPHRHRPGLSLRADIPACDNAILKGQKCRPSSRRPAIRSSLRTGQEFRAPRSGRSASRRLLPDPLPAEYGFSARFAHALERRSRYVMIAGHGHRAVSAVMHRSALSAGAVRSLPDPGVLSRCGDLQMAGLSREPTQDSRHAVSSIATSFPRRMRRSMWRRWVRGRR